MNAPKHELDARLVRFLDGTMDDDEASRLVMELEKNASLRAQLRRIAEQVVAIAEAGRCAEAQQTCSAPTSRLAPLPSPATRRDWRWGNLAKFAAVLILALSGGGWLAVKWRHPQVLEITQSRGAVNWSATDGDRATQPALGQKFSAGTLALVGNDSLVTLQAADGSTITLHGQSEAFFCHDGGWKVRLREGSFEAAVKPQPSDQPLRVMTPTAEIVVKGTKFSMQAQAQETRLEVAEGLVTMRRLADGREASVGGQERLVVTLDHGSELAPQRRTAPSGKWQANFTKPLANADGTWMPPSAALPTGALASRPYLAGRRQDGGVLVHHGMFLRRNGGLATVEADSEIWLKLRMAEAESLQIMLVTTRSGGGFAGNYEVNVLHEVGELIDGWREVRIPLRAFKREASASSPLPVGHVIDGILVNSYTWSAGLEVSGLAISTP